MLKMKTRCQQCRGALSPTDAALICSYECTFCPDCGEALQGSCPNCDGELVRRPRRTRAPLPVAMGLLRRRLSARRDAGPEPRAPDSDAGEGSARRRP